LRAVRNDDPEPPTRRPIRLFGRTIEAAIVSRSALGADDILRGPAIVNQMDTTTLVPPGWQASLAPSGALILQHSGTEAVR
jgi:N-methylhydantoinase A